jgi:LAS superfamily LD-carboxypeptidase LdcB
VWTAEALTGRTRAHIVENATLQCALHVDVVVPLLAMRAAAAADGIGLAVVSAFRDFDRQLAIWNDKFLGARALSGADGRPLDVRGLAPEARVAAILRWSALPGASRHHWGTDIDVIDTHALPQGYRPQLEPHEYAPGGVFARLTTWLDANMGRFGFFRPYRVARGGVQPEAWHLSYAPLAEPALRRFTRGTLYGALAASNIEGREIVLDQIDALYTRYVANVDRPHRTARVSPRLF